MSTPLYNPPRKVNPAKGGPLEVDLVFNVRSCGTCEFFWPEDGKPQTYGPFPAYDFDSNSPEENPSNDQDNYLWLKATTREESFPNGEVMDGCRKAPIMTIGINPNLTAFAPGPTGTSWVYPNFTSDGNTDAWTKYAYYYRYRNVYQEHLNLDFVEQFLLPEGRIIAEKDGKLTAVDRQSESSYYSISVRYEGDDADTKIELKRDYGTPRYVVLFATYEGENEFKKGDIIAARLQVPANKSVDVYQKEIGYYEQFVPTLNFFSEFLQAKGMKGADLKIGEDVGQLDMVACASPHWGEQWLGYQEDTIVNNCVKKNSWAMKQLVQTKPALLVLVGEASWNMFNGAFSGVLKKNTPMPDSTPDGAFTLLKATLDDEDPLMLEFKSDQYDYTLSTRIVVSPHFSYNSNFVSQFRLSEDDYNTFISDYKACYEYLKGSSHVTITPPSSSQYAAIVLNSDIGAVFKHLETHYAEALKFLTPNYFDPHKQMAEVMEYMYGQGKLSYTEGDGTKPGYLTRSDGACKFCVNSHWSFPQGCPYGKTDLPSPAPGSLLAIAGEIVQAGKAG